MDIELIKRNNSGKKKVLVVGVFHGDEPQGEYFIREYLKIAPKEDSIKNSLFYIPRLNSENTRTNKNGVDLNRNFPTKNWELGARDEYFGGEAPNSEEETKFLVNLINENNFDAIITIHAPYKIINYDGPADKLAHVISETTGWPVQKSIGYPTPGSFGTYCGIERNIKTITIEVDEVAPASLFLDKFFKLFNYLENELV